MKQLTPLQLSICLRAPTTDMKNVSIIYSHQFKVLQMLRGRLQITGLLRPLTKSCIRVAEAAYSTKNRIRVSEAGSKNKYLGRCAARTGFPSQNNPFEKTYQTFCGILGSYMIHLSSPTSEINSGMIIIINE